MKSITIFLSNKKHRLNVVEANLSQDENLILFENVKKKYIRPTRSREVDV